MPQTAVGSGACHRYHHCRQYARTILALGTDLPSALGCGYHSCCPCSDWPAWQSAASAAARLVMSAKGREYEPSYQSRQLLTAIWQAASAGSSGCYHWALPMPAQIDFPPQCCRPSRLWIAPAETNVRHEMDAGRYCVTRNDRV